MKKSTVMLLSALVVTMLAMLVAILLINRYVERNIEYGSGNFIKKEYQQGEFQNISVAGLFEITLKQASVPKVTVTTHDNFQKYIAVSVRNNTLFVSNKNVFQPLGCKIDIQSPQFSRINLQGGTQLIVQDSIVSENLYISADGGVNAKVTGVFQSLNVIVSAGSSVTLRGSSEFAEFDISAGSNLMAVQMPVDSCNITSNAGSDAEIFVTGILSANVLAGSTVIYHGNPETGAMNVESGGSLVPKRDD